MSLLQFSEMLQHAHASRIVSLNAENALCQHLGLALSKGLPIGSTIDGRQRHKRNVSSRLVSMSRLMTPLPKSRRLPLFRVNSPFEFTSSLVYSGSFDWNVHVELLIELDRGVLQGSGEYLTLRGHIPSETSVESKESITQRLNELVSWCFAETTEPLDRMALAAT